MQKRELLAAIKEFASQGQVTKSEVIQAYDQGSGTPPSEALSHRLSVSRILYYLGGAIVFIGIAVLLWQNWEVLPDPAKIMVTLGSAIAAFIVGVLFDRYKTTEEVAQAFYFISGLLAPIGLTITLDLAGIDIGTPGMQSVISGTLALVYILSAVYMPRAVFTLFAVLFSTWLYYAFATFLFEGQQGLLTIEEFYEYLTLVAGLSYISFGYFFAQRERDALTGWLYGFGVLGVLGAAFALGGYRPEQNVFWEFFFPFLVFAVIFSSIYLKSRAFLVFGSLFFVGYVLKITVEYFENSLNWPIVLVLVGFLLIGSGYVAFYLNKKYLS